MKKMTDYFVISEEDFSWLLDELYSTHYNNDKYNEISKRFFKQRKERDKKK